MREISRTEDYGERSSPRMDEGRDLAREPAIQMNWKKRSQEQDGL